MGKLAEALKQKYKTPQAALKALGLDTTLLRKEVVGDALPSELKGRPLPVVKMNMMAYAYGRGLGLAMDAIAKDNYVEELQAELAALKAKKKWPEAEAKQRELNSFLKQRQVQSSGEHVRRL